MGGTVPIAGPGKDDSRVRSRRGKPRRIATVAVAGSGAAAGNSRPECESIIAGCPLTKRHSRKCRKTGGRSAVVHSPSRRAPVKDGSDAVPFPSCGAAAAWRNQADTHEGGTSSHGDEIPESRCLAYLTGNINGIERIFRECTRSC